MKKAPILILSMLFLLAIGLPMEELAAIGPVEKKVDEREYYQESLKRRQRTEFMNFYLGNAGDAKLPGTSIAIDLYNQALEFFQQREYNLAKEVLIDALEMDPRSPYASKLMGDVFFVKHDLKRAKEWYKKSYLIRPTEDLREKIEKVNREIDLEGSFETVAQGNFILKFQPGASQKDADWIVGKLEEAYEMLSKDFSATLREPTVVLLYSPEEFHEVSGMPHWVGGLNDGKVRVPAYRFGIEEGDFQAIVVHEVAHSFIGSLSKRKAPDWINEGLAEFEENKIREQDMLVFDAAVRIDSLIPLDQLMADGISLKEADPLFGSLFYNQSLSLVSYMVEKYGMFKMRQLLKQFAEEKNSEEALLEVLEVSIQQLEKEWKDSLTAN